MAGLNLVIQASIVKPPNLIHRPIFPLIRYNVSTASKRAFLPNMETPFSGVREANWNVCTCFEEQTSSGGNSVGPWCCRMKAIGLSPPTILSILCWKKHYREGEKFYHTSKRHPSLHQKEDCVKNIDFVAKISWISQCICDIMISCDSQAAFPSCC